MHVGVRLRITIAAVVAITAVLIVTGILLVAHQRRVLTDTLDELLQSKSRAIADLVANGTIANPITGQGDTDSIAQVVDSHGRVLASTVNIAGRPAVGSSPRGGSVSRTIPYPSERGEIRLYSERVGDVVIHAGARLDDVQDHVAILRNSLRVAIPLAAAVLGLIVWWLVGRTLRPVAELRSAAAAISGSNLARRVPEPVTHDEIGRLARTFNSMLDRLESSARRQREFVADASHELRSPLTRMRAELEVDLAHPETADLAATHRSVLEEVYALQQLVNDLLVLTTSDETPPAMTHRVDLARVVRDTVEAMPSRTGVVLESRIAPATVSGNERDLTRVVTNLVENALDHAIERVQVTVCREAADVVVRVEDDGPGVPEADRERIFQRFVRLDAARTRDAGGAGLGLAIVGVIVHRHNGTVRVGRAGLGGAAFVVRLRNAGEVRSTGPIERSER